MDHFPEFMKHPSNVVASHQRSEGVQGYVFDDVDGSQMAIFEYEARAGTAAKGEFTGGDS